MIDLLPVPANVRDEYDAARAVLDDAHNRAAHPKGYTVTFTGHHADARGWGAVDAATTLPTRRNQVRTVGALAAYDDAFLYYRPRARDKAGNQYERGLW